jgi:sulfopropanediol 3-dehydrogenase
VATFLKKVGPPALADVRRVADTVSAILEAVRADGWDAVRRYSRELDHWNPADFRVGEAEVEKAKAALAPDLLESMDFAHAQIERFARLHRESMHDFEEETLPGVFLGQRHLPIANVGAYVPSGKYPMLMSAQMSILTAKVAGVRRVVACAAPYEGQGIYPAVLWSMHLAGADEIYCVGGVQALGMMAYGCDGLAPVDFLCGPGNMYVAEAKRQLFGEVGIDLLAGPTEILIIADESADPVIVAADLLGQAEHGPTSPAVLISLSEPLAETVLAEVDRQLALLGSAEVAGTAWRDCGGGAWGPATAPRLWPWPTTTRRSTWRCRVPATRTSSTTSATTAPSAWAKKRPSSSPTRPSAPTTPCRPDGRHVTQEVCGSASSSRL